MARTVQVRCDICGEWLDSKDDLDDHNVKHHRQSASAGGSRSIRDSGNDAERDASASRIRSDVAGSRQASNGVSPVGTPREADR